MVLVCRGNLARPIGDVAQHTHVRAPEDRIPAVADDGRARALNFMGVVNDRLSEVTISCPVGFHDIMMGYS